MICENCLYKLELFHDFRERTVRTEKLLIELYREIIANIANVQLNNELHQQSCMVSLDSSELIMVEHQQLVDYQNLDNVSNISLSSMNHCTDMIDNQINLAHENIGLKTFSDINVSSSNLDHQDHSSTSLQIQESSLLASSDTQESHIQEDLQLIQEHQSFADQIEFQLNIQERNIRDLSSVDNVVDMVCYYFS